MSVGNMQLPAHFPFYPGRCCSVPHAFRCLFYCIIYNRWSTL